MKENSRAKERLTNREYKIPKSPIAVAAMINECNNNIQMPTPSQCLFSLPRSFVYSVENRLTLHVPTFCYPWHAALCNEFLNPIQSSAAHFPPINISLPGIPLSLLCSPSLSIPPHRNTHTHPPIVPKHEIQKHCSAIGVPSSSSLATAACGGVWAFSCW